MGNAKIGPAAAGMGWFGLHWWPSASFAKRERSAAAAATAADDGDGAVKVRVPTDSLLGKGAIKASVFENGTFTPIASIRDGDRTAFRFDVEAHDVEYAGAGELVVTYQDHPPTKVKEKKDG